MSDKTRHVEFIKARLAAGFTHADYKTRDHVRHTHIITGPRTEWKTLATHIAVITTDTPTGIEIISVFAPLEDKDNLFKKEPGVQVIIAPPEVVVNDIVIRDSLHFKRQSLEEIMNKEQQKTEVTGGVFTDFIKHITNPDHVWNHEKYVGSRTLNGSEHGIESSVRFQYCRGNAFAEGYVGNLKFRIYYSDLQGFQMYTQPIENKEDIQIGNRPVTFHSDGKGLGLGQGIIQFAVEHPINRKR